MTKCSKCGQKCNPYSISQTYIHPRKGICHRICPRRKEKTKRRTYQLRRPLKRGWRAARKAAIRFTCEVSFAPLMVEGEDGALGRYVGVIDHIVPERYCLAAKVDPHSQVNLICISPSIHGRKRSAEDAFLKNGDVLTFYRELKRQNWPMARVNGAMLYAGLTPPKDPTFNQ